MLQFLKKYIERCRFLSVQFLQIIKIFNLCLEDIRFKKCRKIKLADRGVHNASSTWSIDLLSKLLSS